MAIKREQTEHQWSTRYSYLLGRFKVIRIKKRRRQTEIHPCLHLIAIKRDEMNIPFFLFNDNTRTWRKKA